MDKKKTARVAGFVGALGASALLLGAAANTTGAYFTDSHTGTIDGTTGQVRVTASGTTLNYTDLLPGEYKTKTVGYTAHGTDPEDIWLVFPNDHTSHALTGTPDDHDVATEDALGRYGHLKLQSSGGAHFVSNNLANPGTSPGHTGPSCYTDGNGWGGSTQEATDRSDTTVPFCAPKNAILLQSNLANGQSGQVDIEYGFTKLMTAADHKVASFKIVATQRGIRPDNPNN